MKFLRALILSCGFLATLACAQTGLPPGDSLLTGEPLDAFKLQTEPAAANAVSFEIVNATGPGFTRAWRVATKRDSSPMASIELRALNRLPVAQGDVGLLRFFARATESSDETGAARVLIVIRKNGVDWNSSYEGDFSFRRDWQEIIVPFTFAKDFAQDDAAIMFRFGFKRQTVEIGGVEVLYYGKKQDFTKLPRSRFNYAGRDASAPWRQAALERIEKIRKGDFGVTVINAAGQPVAGAAIKVEQYQSAFQWGVALQMQRLVKDTPDNVIYRQKTLELFNAASTENDLKWPVWLGEWGEDFYQAQTLQGLKWLGDHGFHRRGHVFVWPGIKNLPKPITDLIGTPRQNEIPGMVLAHIRELARATRGLVDEWDVLNEPFTNHDLVDIFGPEIMPPWFKVAREELPNAALYFNDFSNHDVITDADHVAHFEKTARYLLDHGAPVTGLGLQAHFNGRPNAPENILAMLDRYTAQFHLPIRFTEFDVWTFDQELQADFTRDFLILAFSHPAVVGVQHWGFWESTHWRPPAAMYTADWTEKPNAKVYKSLVLDQWRTRLDGSTNAAGRYTGRGFQGDYIALVDHAGKHSEVNFSIRAGVPLTDVKVTLP